MATGRNREKTILGGALATGAVLATLWYGRTYPPTLVGTWTNDSKDSSEVTLTLHAAGRGYYKVGTVPEQVVGWEADGDKIVVTFENETGSLFSGVAGNNRIVATQTADPSVISLDSGSPVLLHRTE